MKALLINGTLKRSPEPSDTEAPAAVVAGRPAEHGVEVVPVRAVDLAIAPGVASDAGTGPDYLEEERGRDWAHSTGRSMADNLHGVARALSAQPLKAPE